MRYLILDLANGAWWFVGLNWISTVTSFFMTIIWMWVDKNYDKMADANKGMVTVCFMWMVCMCIGFAVLVAEEPRVQNDLTPRLKWTGEKLDWTLRTGGRRNCAGPPFLALFFCMTPEVYWCHAATEMDRRKI